MRKNRFIRVGVPAVFALASLWSAQASAWQPDMHYAMTRYLAEQAGFTEQDAETIALADEGVDDASATNAIYLVGVVLFASDDTHAKEASELTRKLHFASATDVPAPPDKRSVAADAPSPKNAALSAKDLKALGVALHAYQDSWSHKGQPDIISLWPKDRPEMQWSHPVARGGWSSQKADVAHVWPQDAHDTAQGTYEILSSFKWAKKGPSATWGSIEGTAVNCMKQVTKADVYACYAKLLPGDDLLQGYVAVCALPRGNGWVYDPHGLVQLQSTNIAPMEGVIPLAPKEVIEQANTWMRALIVDKQFDSAMKMVLPLSTEHTLSAQQENAASALRNSVMDRFKDLMRADYYAPRAATPELASYKRLEDAIMGFSGRSGFDTIRVNRAGVDADYAAVFRFRERPNEGILVLFTTKNKFFPGRLVYDRTITIDM